MKLSRLHTFVRLAELKSFSLVAEELNITQPAVSIQVKALEEHFGVRLVERSSEGISLTFEGELLKKEAKEILRVWETLSHKINQLQDLVKGELVMGASTIPAEYLLPELVVEFCQTYPLVELKMEMGDSKSVIQDLIKKRYDLGIVGVKPDLDNVTSIPLASDELVLVVPKQHPLAEVDVVTGRDLKQTRFIMREEGSGTRNAMEEGLKVIGLTSDDLQRVAQLGSTEAIITGVEAGLGISIVSSLAARRAEKLRRVKVVPIEGFQVQRQFYLTFLTQNREKVLIQTFLEYIQEQK